MHLAVVRQRPVEARVDESALVERARRGDDSAFTALYQRHARYLAGVVYRLMGDDGELDDIVQETFVDAMGQLSALKEPSELRRWLVTIAVRRAYRTLARRRRRRWFAGELAEVAPRAGDRRDLEPAQVLYDVLDKMPPDLRVPWVLHRIEQESLPEVARLCGVSLATVKRRIADAEERLKRKLDGP